MRRKEKQVDDPAVIEDIVRKAQFCRLGMIDHDTPYVVPMNFGYADGMFFVHSASEGRKIDVLRRHPKVCLQLDIDCQLVRSENPCKWGVAYKSVIALGTAAFVDDPDEKAEGLNVIMRHYSGQAHRFPPGSLEKTAVIRIKVEQITAKQSGD